MARIALRLFLAVVLLAIGWSIGLVQGRSREFFRLTINSPIGSTTVRCDGCQLMSWNEGRPTALRELTLTCAGPQSCAETIGGTLAGPLQMASNAPDSQ